MAGRLVVSTLNNDTGVLNVQNGMTGIPKAWVNFNGTGTVSIRSSFNVSSITDNGTGNYTVNFTTAMPNANYSVITTSNQTGSGFGDQSYSYVYGVPTTTTVSMCATNGFPGTLTDQYGFYVAVFSS